LRKFKSVKRVKEADFEDLVKLIGKDRSLKILEYFKNKE